MTGAEEVALDNFRDVTILFGDGSIPPVIFQSISITLELKWKIFIRDVKRGTLKITPEFMSSIESPELKQKVIEAICLAKV